MNQGGKHAAETGRLENKRERRRGAAGRAAVLRRAPSDSDCSGETASLSADSGDRAPRPAPLAPPRSGKTRSRRRGSEWEVLEGLKDGQRFEKRPDVFNGYLHKKRKWPLKGWHKRFFVIDGGILVYARSPTDVARGRLHGSVDVGLSVISAKARRRRIDIDADEFIYHLRAKTPEVFRTWLNILKVHRLYRQHLLTFGARESVPKIHPPLDDLPATDTSSHTSFTSEHSTSIVDNSNPGPPSLLTNTPCNIESSVYSHKDKNSILDWQRVNKSKNSLIPLNFEDLEEDIFNVKHDDALGQKNRSMCSMKCMARIRDDEMKMLKYMVDLKDKQSPNNSMNTTDAEKQITCTDLESLKTTKQQLDATDTNKIIKKSVNSCKGENAVPSNSCSDYSAGSKGNRKMIHNYEIPQKKREPCLHSNKKGTPTACYFFARKKNQVLVTEPPMKKSRKCTNLVKFKNLSTEPPLKNHSSKCMLLGKHHLTVLKHADDEKAKHRMRIATNEEVQVKMDVQENKGSQNVTTTDEYDKITEKLMISIFSQNSGKVADDVKHYIDEIVKDLYDIRVDQEMHPVKALFRNLLEYWLKNTSISQFKAAMTSEKAVDGQSNKQFSKDVNLSSYFISMTSKETQFRGLHPAPEQNKANRYAKTTRQKGNIKYEKVPSTCQNSKRDTESFEKERRIQELERLLRNTVYVCETTRNSFNKERDIKITKKLIDNLGNGTKNTEAIASNEKQVIEKSSSSAEIPDIQETINHLISETSIPADIAKEFLGAYLELLQDSSNSTTTSQFSDWEKQSHELPACEVEAESVIKKVSKSVTTCVWDYPRKDNVPVKDALIADTETQLDPGQVYLKDILDKVTTIFSKVKKIENCSWIQDKAKEIPPTLESKAQTKIKHELGKPVFNFSKKDLIYENCDENALVIDLSKYNLEYVSMFNDPEIKGVMSITIKLKEKPPNYGELKQTHLGLKFSEDSKPMISNVNNSGNWLPFIRADGSSSNDIFRQVNLDSNKVTCLGFETNRNKIDLKPHLNTSGGTSKAHRPLNDSFNSLDQPDISNITHTNYYNKDSIADKRENEDLQSCYLMSIKKAALASNFLSKKKCKVKGCGCDGVTLKSSEYTPLKVPAAKKSVECSAYEKPAPRIIDERFILLLLENLTYLSRNVPTLHRDINTLYIKLKKRHEKVVKCFNNIQGLSLLGKIYSEDPGSKDSDDQGTQYDPKENQDNHKAQKDFKNTSTNTDVTKIEEKCACTYTIKNLHVNSGVQATEGIDDSGIKTLDNDKVEPADETNVKVKSEQPKVSHTDRMTVTQTETIDIDSTDQSTSVPFLNSSECKDTAMRCALTANSTNIPLRPVRALRLERDGLKKKRNSPRMRQELIKEISLLSPSFKVSTQSQTEEQLLRSGMDKRLDKDFNVYRLYLSSICGVKVSSSMTIASGFDADMNDELKTLYRCTSEPSNCSGLLSPTTPTIRGPQAGFVSGTPGGRLAGWIIESGGPLESASRELGQAQLSVQQLLRLLDALELQHQVHHDTDVSLEGASPNVKKDRRKFGLRKKKSNSKCASVELAPPHMDPSSSHTALSSLSALTAPPSPGGGASSMPNSAASLPIACAAARPQSLPGAESLNAGQGPASLTSLTPDHQLREDFTILAKDLVGSLKGIVSSLVCERGRLRAALEAAESAATPAGAVVAALRTNLSSALQQNSELRSRLSRIHDTSDIAELLSLANSEAVNRQFQQSLSYSSSCVSGSEFFDAEEHEEDELKPEEVIAADEAGVIELDGDSSSEAGSLSSEEGSASSDNSEGAMLSAEQETLRLGAGGAGAGGAARWARRVRLPAPRPAPGGPSLWNLLYKNIGKDLSQISMPVTINEPLNMLQRLCEELEYSELLDAAAAAASRAERMALVAAFAVSAYAASAHRAASKPFNPLLAETYECVREDRGFRFLAEQVSHHPPISACHAESPRWCFWQEARIKTKFWGKSMEFQPTGRVHVRLTGTGDHYTWNKVTTCVHNLFGGQRWVDQYGDMHIVCVGTDVSCKLNFVKASSWSHTRHEVRGAVAEPGAGARLRLAGRWSEALYAGEPPAARCLWRPGAMPPEHEIYYGFTRFAMELNEMEPGMREILPHTDTRFRPDQRALEEGDVEAAEAFKHELEQAQRERRRGSAAHAPAWFRKTVEDGEETWVFSGEYWKAREAGFNDDAAPRIW